MNYNEDFINTFNEYYPFERYIVKEPKRVNYLFDDVVLTELFIPSTEIKPLVDENDKFQGFTKINDDEIYVKLKCKDVEFRMAYFDFDEHIREEIRHIIYNDFGQYEWECLYVDHEDSEEELKEALQIQKNKIIEKYGSCEIKESCIITDTINLIKNGK